MPKISRSDAYSVANEIRDRVLARFPELRTNPIDGVWFTGSNVWTALLGEEAPAGSDWDIMLVDCVANTTHESGEALVKLLGLDKLVSISTSKKNRPDERGKFDGPDYADDEVWGRGVCYKGPLGEVDVWHVDGKLHDVLRNFPDHSHAHCRAAYSLTHGLVALPNEAYVPTDETQLIPVVTDEQIAESRYQIGRSRLIGLGAWVILFLLFCAVVSTCAGCAAAPAQPVAPGFGPAEQAARAVELQRTCAAEEPATLLVAVGTGAIVAHDLVLTARHVVDCGGHGTLADLLVRIAPADVRHAVVVWRDVAHDLALVAVPGVAPPSRAVYAAPDVGEPVCFEHAFPTHGRTCGTVRDLDSQLAVNGLLDIKLSAVSVPGNSGSAVYDSGGHIVGVITNSWPCPINAKTSCGALATSVIGRLP